MVGEGCQNAPSMPLDLVLEALPVCNLTTLKKLVWHLITSASGKRNVFRKFFTLSDYFKLGTWKLGYRILLELQSIFHRNAVVNQKQINRRSSPTKPLVATVAISIPMVALLAFLLVQKPVAIGQNFLWFA